MAFLKKKKKELEEPKKKGSDPEIEANKIFEDFRVDEVAHKEWETRAEPEKAYEYFETKQMPKHADSGTSFWVQINRIREAQKTRMGILTNSPPMWEVSGRGKDASDRERIKLIRYMMIWMAKEANLYEELLEVLKNYSLIGMGWLRLRWDKGFLTQMKTVGMTEADSLDPRLCYPDARARKPHVLDGGHCLYVNRVSKERFRQEWSERLLPDGTVETIDVDKIFRDIEETNHPDQVLNANKKENEKEITVLEDDYYRIIFKEIKVGDGKKVAFPIKEYRVALGAGYEKLIDYVSPISPLKMWQKVLFSNDPMHDIPYSSADFQAERELQDLYNVMISMTIDNMSRQMNSPWQYLEGTLTTEDLDFRKENASKPGVYLPWSYTKEMAALGISMDKAKPSREPPGQVGQDWLQTMALTGELFDKISVGHILQGENPSGVKSGKHAQILAANRMQPSYYTKQKLEGPLRRVGQIFYHHARTNLTDEMELPVDDEGIGVEKGIVINRVMPNDEVIRIVEESRQIGDNGDFHIEETLRNPINPKKMLLSIREGEERLSMEEWLKKGNRFSMFLTGDSNAKIVENDITFGNFSVALTLDPMAEASKADKIEQSTAIAQLMIQMGAVKTGLKYLLEVREEPDRGKLMEEAEKEIKESMQNQMGGGMPGQEQT